MLTIGDLTPIDRVFLDNNKQLRNTLMRNGIYYLETLLLLTEEQVLELEQIADASIDSIKKILGMHHAPNTFRSSKQPLARRAMTLFGGVAHIEIGYFVAIGAIALSEYRGLGTKGIHTLGEVHGTRSDRDPAIRMIVKKMSDLDLSVG